MNKTFNRIRLIFTIVSSLELLLVIFLVLFYFLDVNAFKTYFDVRACLIFATSLISVNIIFVAYCVLRIYRLKQLTDIKISNLVGQDVHEAYDFALIGLILVDEFDYVIWQSDLITARGMKILNTNIYEFEPTLHQLKDGVDNKTIHIKINTVFYEVKYLKETRMFIFKDITSLENAMEFSKIKATVLGIIMIDNYSDVVDHGDDSNELINRIRTEIASYTRTHKVLIRRFRNDAYFAVCDFGALDAMMKDQFSLIETVRKLSSKQLTPLTLSIGFAYDFPDVLKLNEMANDAIDVAMSRGGDQVIVSKFGEELRYFGGKTDAQETRNKVKVRVLGDSLVAHIKLAKNVFVLGHSYADMDAIGSCLGIKALCEHLNIRCHIVYDPKLFERKAKQAFTSSFKKEDLAKMIIAPKDVPNNLDANSLVVLVDCHWPSGSIMPSIFEKMVKCVVIDHHRRKDEFVEMPVFSLVDPSASSASELICELIHYCSLNPPVKIDPRYATIMLSGIFLDSNYFKHTTTGMRTFEACMLLKEFGADNARADEFLKDEFEEYTLINQIVATLKTPHVNVVYCMANESYIVEQATLAKVANQCMQMKGVSAAFVIGKTKENETRFSARSDGKINVQLIAEKMGGGGHFTSAAGAFQNKSTADVEVLLLTTLDTFLKKASTIDINDKG